MSAKALPAVVASAAPMSVQHTPGPAAFRLVNTSFQTHRFEYFEREADAKRRQDAFNMSVDDGGLYNLTPLFEQPPILHSLIVEALDLIPRMSDDDPIAPALRDWCRRAATTPVLPRMPERREVRGIDSIEVRIACEAWNSCLAAIAKATGSAS